MATATLSSRKLAQLANDYAEIDAQYKESTKKRKKLLKELNSLGVNTVKSSTNTIVRNVTPQERFSMELFIEINGEEEYNKYKVPGESISWKVAN